MNWDLCKELGMLTLIVEHNYICFYYKEFTTTTCFGPICWAVIRLWLDLQLRLY